MSNQAININDVLGNDFFRSLLKDQHKLSEEIFKRKGFSMENNNFHLLNAHERKTSRTFRLVGDFTTTINDIKIV